MNKKYLLMIGLVASSVLTACGDGETSGEDSYEIGVVQYADHPSLDQATEGFKAAIEEAGLNVNYNDANPNGDQNQLQSIADNFASEGLDLVFANATPAAQFMESSVTDAPILFTSVTDPVGAQLVESLEEPGGNASGTVDFHPDAISNSIELMNEEFGYENIGMIYNTGEQNSQHQVSLAKEAAAALGMTIHEAPIQTTADVLTAAESLLGSIDAFYIITDNDAVAGLDSIINVAERESLPLFVGELDSVEAGGFAGFGFSYYDIGYKTGEMAVEILENGADVSTMSVELPPELKLVFNKGAAERMGLDWNTSWDELAEDVITE
ncbi:ABC transporter substrate-binding protein [Shouchella patagoniensis]|uniref:ABC transporter substrate-binding protein n=1 Tax=Shouchella patagoniensis TaxID=228576 RepID=UPI000995CB9A|nr:ABC transporter substrate-binding protein [Shouchella patagoniensis]